MKEEFIRILWLVIILTYIASAAFIAAGYYWAIVLHLCSLSVLFSLYGYRKDEAKH